MGVPNIQQQLYLKKALNENTDGMFDHPEVQPEETITEGLRNKMKSVLASISEANVSKADKAYRKFGHGKEHDLAQLKRQVGVLRRGGASDETIRKFPKIAAKGGSHNQAEITTARANFMAGGARKRRLGISSPRKAAVSEASPAMDRANKILQSNHRSDNISPAEMKWLKKQKAILAKIKPKYAPGQDPVVNSRKKS